MEGSGYAAGVQNGDVVEDFELPDESGQPRRLSELLTQGPVVLFFYPAAMTYGCTKESCHFRDVYGAFEEIGAQPVGISTDPVAKQHQFAETHSFPFPLLSDADGTVAAMMGVKRRFGPVPVRRTTFVIGTDRRILERVHNEFQMSAHADRALEALKRHAAA